MIGKVGEEMINDLVNQKRIRLIWTLAWPLMMSQILQTLLQMVDMWFISNLGITEAIAATGYSTSTLGVIIMFSQLIAAGGIALISRKTGEGDEQGTFVITEQALFLAFCIGTIITILGYFFSQEILYLFGMEKAVEGYALTYFRIVLIGVPFTFFNLTGRAILQATGDSKGPMMIFIIMNIINIILDPILIYGLHTFDGLGFKGAAVATAISNIVAFILMFLTIAKKVFDGNIHKMIRNFRISFKTIGRIIKIGFFSAIQAISRPITGLAMFTIAGYSGTKAVAAFTIGGRMFNLVFIFLTGLNMAISVLVGQNLGKKDFKEAEEVVKDGIKLAALNMVVFAVAYFLLPKFIMLAFIRNDMEVVQIGMNYLRITYLGLMFVVFPIVYGGAFIGAGNTAPPMVASLVANWGFKLPFALIFSQVLGWGANGVWIAISGSVIVEAGIIAWWFKRGKWKHKRV
ncbi:MATE family efflux transporter [Sporosalibacterium faouarense]|uniref:MATE family efflux transporter n=1 Tax=Sporosalibacterium faouarense TaxID=516123 RepID=UPI00141C108D|nr:MATE family efflux transporter [Sporosalibacterium faouarense]MTI49493.1 MATE family efflux transporter [Bacillota bacterium]